MQEIISLPAWMIITAVALPTTCLFMLVFRLWRQKSKRKALLKKQAEPVKAPQPAPAAADTSVDFTEQINRQVLSQHIDAVFNALIAVIETERIKLKALSGRLSTREVLSMTRDVSAAPATQQDRKTVEAPSDANSLGRSIADLAAQGLGAEEIARRMGLSKNEVALAIHMSSHRQPNGAKLEAVA